MPDAKIIKIRLLCTISIIFAFAFAWIKIKEGYITIIFSLYLQSLFLFPIRILKPNKLATKTRGGFFFFFT